MTTVTPANDVDTLVVPPTFPELGKVRCYWAVMDSGMNYRYIDPVLAHHMQNEASFMIGRNLVDFIHPDEKIAARDDFAKFRTSTTIFGSVTRCRYARIPHCRRILGAPEADIASDTDEYSLDDYWLSSRITASLVAENTVLTFYHATHDLDPVADGDDVHLSTWTNWCGPIVQDIGHEYLTPFQQEALHNAFIRCRNESIEAFSEAKQPIGGHLPPPSYVFQILGSNDDQIYFTWPPIRPTGEREDEVVHGKPIDGSERYIPSEYATLARSVIGRQKEKHPESARTSCTKRYQSKHPLYKGVPSSTVESVVIAYQALTFVCFQRPDRQPPKFIYGNTSQIEGKRKADDVNDEDTNAEILKRLRTENASALLGSFNPSSQDGSGNGEQNFPAMPLPAQGQEQLNQPWVNPEDPDNAYYPNESYPSVYSQMFQNLGSNQDEPGAQANSNGLHNLAMASASTYYSDYDGNGQPQIGPDGEPLPDLQFIPRQRGEASNQLQAEEAVPPSHRVRKADRNRICTSCGTTNSPEWRKGPSGIKTLCNACGLRYSRAQARKKKKEQKENSALEAAAGAAGNIGSSGSTPPTPYLPAPLQMPPGMGPSGLDDGQGDHSPYMNISVDYGQHSAPLPPLPQSAGLDDGHQGHQSEVLDHGQGGHQGNGNYGGYGAWSGYSAYNDWSPNTQQNFAQHQDQPSHHHEHDDHQQ